MTEPYCYLGIKGGVTAINNLNGEIVWRRPLRGSGFVMLVVDGDLILAYTGGHLFGIERQSGVILWENGLKGMGYGVGTIALPGNPPNAAAVFEQILEEKRSRESKNFSSTMDDD